MQKKNIENDVKKVIKKFRKVQFLAKDDLYKNGLVDSFDILNIIEELDKKFNIKLDFSRDKKFIFSVNYIVKKITLYKK